MAFTLQPWPEAIYVAESYGLIKIGHTQQSIHCRVLGLHVGGLRPKVALSPAVAKFWTWATLDHEQALHRALQHVRIPGTREWYEPAALDHLGCTGLTFRPFAEYPIVPSCGHCSVCLKIQATAEDKRRRAAGLCIKCKGEALPVSGTTIYCAVHREENRARSRAYARKVAARA